MKRIYVLRLRLDEDHLWSAPEYFRSKRGRDLVAAENRILAGIRVHCYEKRVTQKELEEIEFVD